MILALTMSHQFINDNSNQRTDKYGGSLENRCRLTLEVLAALTTVFPAGRIGVRFSPAGTFNDMQDSNPKETYTYLISEADKLVSQVGSSGHAPYPCCQGTGGGGGGDF